jgi:nucleoside-diphosphate-sugar epimerase
MRVFVTGATGVAGRRAVVRLVAAGHEVTGVARSEEKAAQLRAVGAAPVRVSLFDTDALREAMAGHDAVVNLATKIPPVRDASRASAWEENNRIRLEGSGALVDAAIAAGVGVFVQESLAFLYDDHGAEWIDAASAPLASSPFTAPVRAAEENVARFTATGGRGVVLRFGFFYAPDSEQTRSAVRLAQRGLSFDFGAPDAYTPSIDADDVASAVVAALDVPAGVYDIVDDEPLTRAERDDALARAIGRRRLWRAPAWAMPKRANALGLSRRVSNRRFRDASGWGPSSPSRRAGMQKVVRDGFFERALSGRDRLMLWFLAFGAVGVGMQAAFFPRSFYDDFPFGRGWVAMDGRYNEHLIRDVGALNLALLVLTLGTLFIGSRALSRLTAVSWLVYSIPHFVYHLRHLTMVMPGADKIGIVVSLATTVVAPLVILLPERLTRRSDAGDAGGLSSPGEARALHVSRT